MGTEIERRFLVKVKELPRLDPPNDIHQGYLSQKPAVRVRLVQEQEGEWKCQCGAVWAPGRIAIFEEDCPRCKPEDWQLAISLNSPTPRRVEDPDPSVDHKYPALKAFLTIKGEGTIKKAEYEYPIPVEDGQEVLRMCPHVLHKERYRIHHEGHGWEVDEFLGALRGLWIAEIELKDTEETFAMPPWVGREVTHDSRYSNAKLAMNGLPDDLQRDSDGRPIL